MCYKGVDSVTFFIGALLLIHFNCMPLCLPKERRISALLDWYQTFLSQDLCQVFCNYQRDSWARVTGHFRAISTVRWAWVIPALIIHACYDVRQKKRWRPPWRLYKTSRPPFRACRSPRKSTTLKQWSKSASAKRGPPREKWTRWEATFAHMHTHIMVVW